MKFLTLQIENQNPIYGGAYKKYMELIEVFLRSGWEGYHISPIGFSNIFHNNLHHIEIRKIPFILPSANLSIQSFLFFITKGKKIKFDYIIAFSDLEACIGLILKLFSNKTKVIAAFHGDSIEGLSHSNTFSLKKSVYMFLIKKITKFVLINADVCIFVSEYNKIDMLNKYNIPNSKNYFVIYNNIIESKNIKLDNYDKRFEKDSTKTIGFVGNIYCEGKGIKYLLQAFIEVKSKFPNSKLIIVGKGPDERVAREFTSRHHLNNDVIFTGYQDNPLAYIQKFDLMVLPSLHEACPLVILEALYVGTPVIASRVGGIPELLLYDELMFEPKNTKKLSDKILTLLEDESQYQRVNKLCIERRELFMFDWGQEMMNTILKGESLITKK